MNILLVGSGGREHALAWKIAQSPLVKRLVVAPGNPGMARHAELRPELKVTDAEGLAALAREMKADLVVVGPESALAEGLADRLNVAGIPCFGPTAKAALNNYSAPYVIKADGLAAGKGVAISPDKQDAEAEIERMLGGRFGSAGSRVVIEEFMDGEEGSLFALCDGQRAVLFGGAQDHKRAFDGDMGPNTGGMGAYSPAPVFTPELVQQADERVVQPTIRMMAAGGAPYRGVLYAGLMATSEGPKVVEFNARFGDPECQVLMMRFDGDIVPLLLACARGDLTRAPAPRFKDGVVICVVLAAKGYPDSPLEGSVIRGADQDFGPHVQVFHAGTRKREDGTLVAAGGRVLNVCAYGADIAEARARAYEAIAKIDWPGGFHRSDIGWRALEPR